MTSPRKVFQAGFEHAGKKQILKFSFDLSRGNHSTVYAALSQGSFYEPDMSSLFQHTLKEGDTVVDVGANLGCHSLFMSRFVGQSGCVIAFEPDPTNIADLKTNIALNSITNIKLHEVALSSSKSDVSLCSSQVDGGWSWVLTGANSASLDQTLSATESAGNRVVKNIPADTLDALTSGHKPRFVKIDVEGYEGLVLDGARSLLGLGSVEYWAVEYAPHCLARYGEDQWSIRKRFSDFGYDCFIIARSGALPIYVPKGTEIITPQRFQNNYIINMLFTRPEYLGRDYPRNDFAAYAYSG